MNKVLTRFGFPLVGETSNGEETPVALLQPIEATAAVGPFHGFNDHELRDFGYHEVAKLCARLLDTADFKELSSFVASRNGVEATKDQVESFRPNFSGCSAQLAFLLAILSNELGFREPWREDGVVWATGAVREERYGDLVLIDILDFEDKLKAFTSPMSSSQLFLCPAVNWHSNIQLPDGICKMRWEDIEEVIKKTSGVLPPNQKFVVLIQKRGLRSLVAALFDTDALSDRMDKLFFTPLNRHDSHGIAEARTLGSSRFARIFFMVTGISLLAVVTAILTLAPANPSPIHTNEERSQPISAPSLTAAQPTELGSITPTYEVGAVSAPTRAAAATEQQVGSLHIESDSSGSKDVGRTATSTIMSSTAKFAAPLPEAARSERHVVSPSSSCAATAQEVLKLEAARDSQCGISGGLMPSAAARCNQEFAVRLAQLRNARAMCKE